MRRRVLRKTEQIIIIISSYSLPTLYCVHTQRLIRLNVETEKQRPGTQMLIIITFHHVSPNGSRPISYNDITRVKGPTL